MVSRKTIGSLFQAAIWVVALGAFLGINTRGIYELIISFTLGAYATYITQRFLDNHLGDETIRKLKRMKVQFYIVSFSIYSILVLIVKNWLFG